LERLLGDDTEVNLELKNRIVNEFAKKHLKALVNTEAMYIVEKSIRADIEKFLLNSVADRVQKNYSTSFTIKPALLEDARRQLDISIEDEVKKCVQESMLSVLPMVNDAIEIAVTKIENQLTEQILSGKIDQLVTHRMESVIKKMMK